MVFVPNSVSDFKWRRSVLFMPATNQRALEKAPQLGNDAIIFDLEDAIAGESKIMAHQNLLSHVKDTDFANKERIIRIGDKADLKVALDCKPDAILLPKVEKPEAVVELEKALLKEAPETKIWAMIETPMGLLNVQKIASASNLLECLVVGPNDLMKATGVKAQSGRAALQPWLMMIIAAARAYGLTVLDGVYNNFKNHAGFAEEADQAAKMGFDGKTLIHPSQIAPANQAFGPQDLEIDQARKIIAAFDLPENRGKGVIQFEGIMLERLHLEQATALLEISSWLK